jgi:hypothetical protein
MAGERSLFGEFGKTEGQIHRASFAFSLLTVAGNAKLWQASRIVVRAGRIA